MPFVLCYVVSKVVIYVAIFYFQLNFSSWAYCRLGGNDNFTGSCVTVVRQLVGYIDLPAVCLI
jgi:hypothetical protein